MNSVGVCSFSENFALYCWLYASMNCGENLSSAFSASLMAVSLSGSIIGIRASARRVRFQCAMGA